MNHIKAKFDDLWFDHCFNESSETNEKLVSIASNFIGSVDSTLLKEVQCRVGDRNTAIEVNNHFSQDKPEWLLQQEFEAQLERDAYNEANDPNAMYLHHFPNEC
tara:strand:- start:2 stop:313 length:312 start_codon:yes stop_codon:yes gene_type:complete